MHSELAYLFELFRDYQVAVIGSVLQNWDRAHDIDLLFLTEEDFKAACHQVGIRYNGWDRHDGHVRRANLTLPLVSKLVQLTHHSAVKTFHDHPYCVLLRTGERLHDGHYYPKK